MVWKMIDDKIRNIRFFCCFKLLYIFYFSKSSNIRICSSSMVQCGEDYKLHFSTLPHFRFFSLPSFFWLWKSFNEVFIIFIFAFLHTQGNTKKRKQLNSVLNFKFYIARGLAHAQFHHYHRLKSDPSGSKKPKRNLKFERMNKKNISLVIRYVERLLIRLPKNENIELKNFYIPRTLKHNY